MKDLLAALEGFSDEAKAIVLGSEVVKVVAPAE